jgi:hypothetical protein
MLAQEAHQRAAADGLRQALGGAMAGGAILRKELRTGLSGIEILLGTRRRDRERCQRSDHA